MKVYLVYGDVYFHLYGSSFRIFGIFTSLEQAKKVKQQKEKEYFEAIKDDEFSYVEKESDVCFDIMEVNLDVISEEYMGGYIE